MEALTGLRPWYGERGYHGEGSMKGDAELRLRDHQERMEALLARIGDELAALADAVWAVAKKEADK